MEKKMENEMEPTIMGILGIIIMNIKLKLAHQILLHWTEATVVTSH